MVKKVIIAVFIVAVTATSFLGIFNISTGRILIGYPVLLADIFTHAPDGSDMNQRNINDRIKNDIETMTLIYTPQIVEKLTHNGGQLKWSECYSTLEQFIYTVQASIRFFQGHYPDSVLDNRYQWNGYTYLHLVADPTTNLPQSPPNLKIECTGFMFYYNVNNSESPVFDGSDIVWYFHDGKFYFNEDPTATYWWTIEPNKNTPILDVRGSSQLVTVRISNLNPNATTLVYRLNNETFTHHWSDGELYITLIDGNNELKFQW